MVEKNTVSAARCYRIPYKNTVSAASSTWVPESRENSAVHSIAEKRCSSIDDQRFGGLRRPAALFHGTTGSLA
eukprot:3391582-Karenia_brevis.AAC.1